MSHQEGPHRTAGLFTRRSAYSCILACLLSLLLPSTIQSGAVAPLKAMTSTSTGQGGGGNSLIWKSNLHAACVSTPTLTHDGSLLLIGCNDRHVTALHTHNGTIAWRREMRGRIQASPLVSSDDTAFLASDMGDLMAVDAATGKIHWRRWVGSAIRGSPVLSEDQKVLYLAIGSFFVTLSSADGSTLSQLDLGSTIETTPLLSAHGRLGYVASTDSYLYAVNVTDAQGPSMLWKYETGDYIDFQSSPCLSPDEHVVYVGGFSRRLHAVDAGTGQKRWTFQANDTVATPNVAQDGTIYVGSSDRHLYALSPEGELQWSFQAPHAIQSRPSLEHGVLTVGTSGKAVFGVSSDSGKALWAFPTGGWVLSSPVIAPDHSIYFGSLDRHVYRLAPSDTLALLSRRSKGHDEL